MSYPLQEGTYTLTKHLSHLTVNRHVAYYLQTVEDERFPGNACGLLTLAPNQVPEQYNRAQHFQDLLWGWNVDNTS